MPQFRTKRRVRHSAAQMFDLVADMERYPEFVPLCQAMRLRKRAPGANDTETVIAEMTVAYKMINETFTSRVTLDRPNLTIGVAYLDGPFQRLDNRWTFTPVSEGVCDVEFYISYEFRNRVLAMLMGAMFDAAFRRFASAFEHRADIIYRPAITS